MKNPSATFLLLALCSFFSLLPAISSFADEAELKADTSFDPKTASAPGNQEGKEINAIVQQIDANISRGKGEFKACGKFKKKFKKIVPGGLNIESPSHLDKKQALDYLAVLEKYPEPARGFDKAMDLYRMNIDLLLKEPNQGALMGRLGSIEGECAMFSMVVHATLLMRDVKAFNFSKKEKAKVEKFAHAYLRPGGGFAGLPEAGVKGKVLEAYLENVYGGDDREALLEKARAFVKDVDARITARHERGKQIKAEGKSNTLEYFRPEWDGAGAAAASYAALVKEALL